MTRLIGLSLGLSFVLATVTSEVWAFKCSRVSTDEGPSLFWNTRTISYIVDSNGSADIPDRARSLEEIQHSFQTWTDVVCSDFAFQFGGARPGLKAGYDPNSTNANVVTFVAAGWTNDRAIIAVTTNSFDTQTGRIYDSDIELNDQNFTFTIADLNCDRRLGWMDLRNALTHEAGHVLGLDHPPGVARYAEDTMYASAPPCETLKQTLADDDIAGICAIYPAGEPTKQCYSETQPSLVVASMDSGYGSGGCRDLKAGGSSPLVAFAWVAFALNCRAKSRRSRRSS